MPIGHLFNQPLTVQTMGVSGLNAYGEPQAAAVGAPTAVNGYLEQTTTVEFLVDRETTVSHWSAYLPATTVISTLDYINFQAQKFQVDGVPEHCFNPRTKRVSHIRCNLLVVAG